MCSFLFAFCLLQFSLLVVCGIPSSILNTSESSTSLENKHHVKISEKTAYHVLIDSGSTGSRIYIYQYEEDDPLRSLMEVAHKRVRPALSEFFEDYRGLKKQMQQLLRFAESYVDETKRSRTSLSLQATAGLRIMPIHEQEWLISHVRTILSASSFDVVPFDTRVLTGGEEALFGLLATNAAFGDLSLHSAQGLLLGAADLGGSSQQIAFMLPKRTFSFKALWKNFSWGILWGKWPSPYPSQCKPDYRLAINGSSEYLEVFARSLPSLGLVEALRDTLYELSADFVRNRQLAIFDQTMVESNFESQVPLPIGTISILGNSDLSEIGQMESISVDSVDKTKDDDGKIEQSLDSGASSNISSAVGVESTQLFNPCVSTGERYPYPDELNSLPWVGTGNFDECVLIVKEKLARKAEYEMSCLKGFSRSDSPQRSTFLPTIVSMDNFPKVLEVLKLANDSTVTPKSIKEAGIRICQTSWTDTLSEFPGFFPFRAHQACFGASFIYAITTELYGLNENDSTSFFPTDNHHSYTVGWPLGSTIYSVMKWTFEEMTNESSIEFSP